MNTLFLERSQNISRLLFRLPVPVLWSLPNEAVELCLRFKRDWNAGTFCWLGFGIYKCSDRLVPFADHGR
jgi:hypothetical protein